VQTLDMEEGKPITPVLFLVKESKIKACKPIIDLFTGDVFTRMLRKGGGLMPEEINRVGKHFFMSLDEVAPVYNRLEKQLGSLYLQHLELSEAENSSGNVFC
jgi:hypothetical protein